MIVGLLVGDALQIDVQARNLVYIFYMVYDSYFSPDTRLCMVSLATVVKYTIIPSNQCFLQWVFTKIDPLQSLHPVKTKFRV